MCWWPHGSFDLVEKKSQWTLNENSQGTMATQQRLDGSGSETPQRTLESKNTNSFCGPVSNASQREGGKKGHATTSPRPAPPSIHLHTHKNGQRTDPPDSTEARNNPPFQPPLFLGKAYGS